MILKRLIFFNLIISAIIISIFYYQFNLSWYSIPVHLVIISYEIFTVFSICILITKFLPRRVSHMLLPLILLISYLLLVFLYSLYYVSLDNWGHPITFNIIVVYINELRYLYEALPISKTILEISIFIPVLLLLILIFSISNKVVNDFHKLVENIFRKRKPAITLGLLATFVIPIILLQFNWVTSKIGNFQLTKYEPTIATFFYTVQKKKITEFGGSNLVAKNNYPDSLSFNKKNVILIVCDALRSDHIGAYNYVRNTTPFIDSLVKWGKAIKLDHFYSTGSKSTNAIVSMLSSQYEMAYNNFYLHDLLFKQGYRTNFILCGDHTNFYGLKSYFGKNVDEYYDGYSASKTSSDLSINDDEKVILRKLDYLPNSDDAPSFFYLHFMSVHQIGVTNDTFAKYFPDKIDKISTIPSEVLINNYDNRMLQLDQYLKRALSKLKSKGYLENSIVIITGDHGQALMEDGRYWHGKSTYLSEISIPFILFETGETANKDKKTMLFSNQLDLAPTIIDLLNIPKPETWQGESIFNERKAKYIFQQEREYYSTIWSMDTSIFQYVYNDQTEKEEIFDITSNKQSEENLVKTYSAIKLDSIRSKIEDFFSIQIVKK